MLNYTVNTTFTQGVLGFKLRQPSNSVSCYTGCMIIAVDTGGTKTLVAGFSRDGKLLHSKRLPTPRDFAEYTAQTLQLIRDVAGNDTIESIAVALPGVVVDNIALRCPRLGWENVDIHTPIVAEFPGIPVHIGNDADIAGIGEARVLSPMPTLAIYITFSTGIGAGFAIDGKLVKGIDRFEPGKAVLEYDRKFRLWEDFASGKALYEIHGRYASDITDPEIWHEFAQRMACGLMVIIPMFEPDYLIIGGSLGTYFDRYEHALLGAIKRHVPAKYLTKTQIVQAKYPEEAVIYGGYHYAVDALAD